MVDINQIHSKYEKLVYKECHRINDEIIKHRNKPEFEDIVQEAWYHITKSIDKYDGKKGSMTTYLTLFMRSRVRTYIFNWMNRHNKPTINLDIDQIDFINFHRGKVKQDKICFENAMINCALSNLDRKEKEVVELLSGLYSPSFTKEALSKAMFPNHRRGRYKVMEVANEARDKIKKHFYIDND